MRLTHPHVALGFIRNGLEFLRAHGWGQGRYHLPDDRYCAVGALAFGNSYNITDTECREEVTLLEELAGTQFCLTRWNDEPGRTKEQVVDLFERAIRTIEEGGALL